VKVLVVDDHPLILEALDHVLKALSDDMTVLGAQNVSNALAIATAHPDIELILLDLGLPDKDGLDALHEFREQHPAIPVVVLSASEDPNIVLRAVDAGAMGFIPKASKNNVLVNALRLVLSGAVYLPPQVLRQASSGGAEVRSSAVAAPTFRDIGLTERQAQVLHLLIQGKSNKLICRELGLAEGTVKIHVTAILKALGVINRTQAVIAVGRLGLQFGAARATASPA
jgi:DNA-binding NarL/FixJ family response regulator